MKRWEAQVAPLLPAVFQMPQETREDLDRKVEALHDTCIRAMNLAAEMRPKRQSIKPAAWWNEECAQHVELLRTLSGPAKTEAQKSTKSVFRKAKRTCYNKICEEVTPDTIWKMAK